MEPDKSNEINAPTTSFSHPPPNFGNNLNNNSAPLYQDTYFSTVQQYAQNRLQQMGPNDFFRPPFYNHQQSNQSPNSLFNKPIRFNINKQGMKVNPMMRPQINTQMQNSNMQNFQNATAKKRKNKKKNKKNKNGGFAGDNDSDGFGFNSPVPLPPMPSDFHKPPPPFIAPPSPSTTLSNFRQAQEARQEAASIEPKSAQLTDSTNKTANAASSANPGVDWPESLYNYVARCYEKCETPLDKDMCDITLKGKITAAANREELWTKDWENEPLPILHSERIKQQQQPTANIFNRNKTVVTGQLTQFQNNPNTVSAKKGISSPLGARLGKSNLPKKRSARSSSSSSRSRSRSNSRSPPRKRRSSEDDRDGKYKPSLSLNNKSGNKKKSRKEKMAAKVSAFYTKSGAAGMGGFVDSTDSERLKKRADRFNSKSSSKPSPSSVVNSFSARKRLTMPTAFNPIVDDSMDDGIDFLSMHVIGTCRDLEKPFLRLTRAVLPSEIRPVDVLVFSLHNVKNKWVEKQDYYYACDQLKSIRQDLTVQGIRDEFTIKVYETHARFVVNLIKEKLS